MKISTGSRRWTVGLTLVAMACAAERSAHADAAAAAGQQQLKWTPHRASASPVASPADEPGPAAAAAAVEPRAAAPARLQSVPGAAASVQLPDGVPPVESLRSPVAAPAAGRPRTALPTQARRPAAPPLTDGGFRMDVFRTPTRNATRPILADESPAPANRVGVERLGGGLAPRYDGGRRPTRLVAGVDALPSVMKQTPQQAPAASDPGIIDAPETIGTPAPSSADPTPIDQMPGDIEFGDPAAGDPSLMADGADGLMLGEYPPQMHVESFYDDPYACEDEDPLCHHSGRICAWLRRFGRPYYGWRWYRDFTVGAGPVAFTNASDLGLNGNFGFNEFANLGMPFWNAFGVGWQVGVRGTQTNFQGSRMQLDGGPLVRNGRQQVFVTSGFFTRAFEGRGLQGGAVYDYLHDDFFQDSDIAQLRFELSYVWGYHEVGFWGASNITDDLNFLSTARRKSSAVANTLDMYTAFYRLQFGDANEWKVWGGATGYGDGIIGSIVRAPMSRSWGLEGFFTYVIPQDSQTLDLDGQGTTYTFSPAAWNVGVNLVFYPGGRSRRGLASPYRPLFDVADNGTMIRRLGVLTP